MTGTAAAAAKLKGKAPARQFKVSTSNVNGTNETNGTNGTNGTNETNGTNDMGNGSSRDLAISDSEPRRAVEAAI